MDEGDEIYETLLDRLLSVEYALWGALIMIDGILVSADSVLVTMINDSWRYGLLVSTICAGWAAFLIFENFIKRRAAYRTLYTGFTAAMEQKSLEPARKMEQKAEYHKSEEKKGRYDEKTAIRLTYLSVIFSVVSVYGHMLLP
jgi:hypothetical protein